MNVGSMVRDARCQFCGQRIPCAIVREGDDGEPVIACSGCWEPGPTIIGNDQSEDVAAFYAVDSILVIKERAEVMR